MDRVIEALACMAAATFFGALLRQPKKTLVYTALIGLLGYVVYLLLGMGILAFFVSGLLVGLLCELTARIVKHATTLFLISSIIPTVPGLGLYRAMMALSQGDMDGALSTGVATLAGIGAIALSLTIATALFNSIKTKPKKEADHLS